jgi:MFS family permease
VHTVEVKVSDGAPRSASTGTFVSLGNPVYRLLFISGAISFLAVQAQFVARGWLANDLTGSNTGLGGVYMAFGVPLLLATPFGGVVADRVSKRNVLLCTQVAFASSALWIGLGVQFGFVQYWMLLVVSAIQAVGFAFMVPARMAMTSEIVGRGLLTNAIVLGQMSLNTTRVIGPALAGVGIGVAWFGLAGVYFASSAISGLAFAMLLPLSSAPAVRSGPPRSPAREFVDGLGYVQANREVKLLLITSFVVVMVAFPYVAFMPRVATELFDVGAAGYGALSAVSAVGAVVTSLYVARRSGPRAAWRIQTVAGVGFGAGCLLLAVAPTYALALVGVFVIGGAASGFQSMNNSLVLGMSEFEFHGRIQSLMMLSFSGFGMAALPLGMLADRIGLRPTFTAMGLVTIAAMAIYLLVRGPSSDPSGARGFAP